MGTELKVLQAINTILFATVQANKLISIVSAMIAKKQLEAATDFRDEEWAVIRGLLTGYNERLRKAIEETPKEGT